MKYKQSRTHIRQFETMHEYNHTMYDKHTTPAKKLQYNTSKIIHLLEKIRHDVEVQEQLPQPVHVQQLFLEPGAGMSGHNLRSGILCYFRNSRHQDLEGSGGGSGGMRDGMRGGSVGKVNAGVVRVVMRRYVVVRHW